MAVRFRSFFISPCLPHGPTQRRISCPLLRNMMGCSPGSTTVLKRSMLSHISSYWYLLRLSRKQLRLIRLLTYQPIDPLLHLSSSCTQHPCSLLCAGTHLLRDLQRNAVFFDLPWTGGPTSFGTPAFNTMNCQRLLTVVAMAKVRLPCFKVKEDLESSTMRRLFAVCNF